MALNKKDTLQRSFFGLIYVIIILGSIMYDKYTFFALLVIINILCLKEFTKMLRLSYFYKIYTYIFSLCFLWISSKQYYLFYQNEILMSFMISLSFLILVMYELFRGEYKDTIKNLSGILLSFVYIVLPLVLVMKIPFQKTGIYSAEILVIFFISIWLNDTFAFVFGNIFGKRKLFERISPKKTIEGFIGGMLVSLSATVIFKNHVEYLTTIDILAIVFISVFFGTIGDLVESMFKRIHKIKDSGNIMPGHGGLLDRLDSFIFSVPFIYLYLFLTAIN